MAEITQDFKYTAVGRIKDIHSELMTGDNPNLRGRTKTTIVLEQDKENRNKEHTQLVITAFGERAANAEKFAVDDSVKVQGRMAGSATPRVGKDGLEHYRPNFTLSSIEAAEGLEHEFTFEAIGKLERVNLGRTVGTGDASANVVLSRTFGQDNDKTVRFELNAYRGAALDLGEAKVGDIVAIRGSMNSKQQLDFETNEVRCDANGHPYYNTYVAGNEVVNLTPQVEKSNLDTPEAESAEIPF